jgi:hypothetical protein
MTLIAKIAMAMPLLSAERKQFWIERPLRLKNKILELFKWELEIIYETFITTSLSGGTFAPLECINKVVRTSKSLEDLVPAMAGLTVSLAQRRIRYTHTKKEASSGEIREELTEEHFFKCDMVYLLGLVVGLLKNHETHGSAIGLMKGAPNIIFTYLSVGPCVLKVEWEESDNEWQLELLPYTDSKVWPSNTRVFFPPHNE